MTKETIGLTAAQTTSVAHDTGVDPYLLTEGFELIRQEKTVRFRAAVRQHWRALLWSCFLSLALVMDGFDGAIINSFYGLPSFKEKFGTVQSNGQKAISANYQTALSNIGLPGTFLGLFITGYCQERFGSRKTYLGGMAYVIAVIFLFVFCQNMGMLLATEALANVGWAMFNTLTAAYAAEICPIHLRGYAASWISFCWGAGSFIASGVNRGALSIEGNWGWRMAYCVQWVWPIPLFIGCLFAPESPYFLVRKGRVEEARKTLTRIASPGYWDTRNLEAYIAVIKHTDALERAEAKSGSFWELFKGTNLRRTEVMMGVWAIQVYSGTAMTAYAVEFFETAGMSVTTAFNLNIVVTAMNLVGCFCDFFLMSRFGRRPLIICGLISLAMCLLLIGILGSVHQTPAGLKAIGAFMVCINLFYHASVGPLTYTVAAEVPSSRLRARSVAFGRGFYSANYAAINQLTPRMVSETAWNWGAKAGFFWFGLNCLATTWAYFRLPETGGFSYAELDILFANRVSARKFTHVVVRDEAVEGNNKFGGMDDEEEGDAATAIGAGYGNDEKKAEVETRERVDVPVVELR